MNYAIFADGQALALVQLATKYSSHFSANTAPLLDFHKLRLLHIKWAVVEIFRVARKIDRGPFGFSSAACSRSARPGC